MIENEFTNLAERLLHSIIRAGLIEPSATNCVVRHRSVGGAISLAIEMATEFTVALKEHQHKTIEGTGLTSFEFDLIKQGRAIAAIKSVRDRTKLCLKESKSIVDQARVVLNI